MSGHFSPDPVKVEVLDDFVLRVTFTDGKITLRDMKPHLARPAFRKLNNKSFFSLVHIDDGGCITWPGDIDIAPEFFYYE